MKRNRLILAICVIFVAVSMLTLMLYFFLQREQMELSGAERVDVINASFEVGDRIGINADRDMLNFGIIMPGGGSRRSINITNTHPYNITVKIFAEGNITRFLNYEDNVVVESNEIKEIFLGVGVPEGSKFESYSGNVTLAIFRS